MGLWAETLKSKGLPFQPENIFEAPAFKAHMEEALETYSTKIKP